MILSMSHQALVFVVMALCGGASGLIYDFFRALRRQRPTGRVIIALMDMLFWIFVVILFFTALLYLDYGQVRGFNFIGLGLGALLYFLTLSKFAISFITKLFVPFQKFYLKSVRLCVIMRNKLGNVRLRMVKQAKRVRRRKGLLFSVKTLVCMAVAVVIVIFTLYVVNNLMNNIERSAQEITRLEYEIQLSELRALEIEYSAIYVQSESFIEHMARTLLGLVRQDETIFIIRDWHD